MPHLFLDLETFSSVDIRSGGLYKYVQSPDFEILLFAHSFVGSDVEEPVIVSDLATGGCIHADAQKWLFDPAFTKHAHNAAFEWYCLAKHFGLTEEQAIAWLPQWRCTQVHSLYCGYPGGLDAVGKALELPEAQRKKSTGQALIRTFCIPCKPTARNGQRTRTLPHHEPEKWELFKEYNAQDVATEMEVERRLAPWPVPDALQKQWQTDLAINARGVALDLDLISGALRCNARDAKALTDEAVALTGLDNPGSVARLRGWLEEETGEEITDLQKATVADLLGGDIESETARRVLEIRQALGKTSIKKYDAMAAAVCADGRARGLLQFYGANRTGRWGGRIIQPQNLPRTYLPLPMQRLARELVKKENLEGLQLVYGGVPDTLSQLIRTAFVPKPGHVFIDADFSAIEARVLAWLAQEQWRLDVFHTHGKIYEASASQMFGVPLEHIVKGRPEYELRQRGKVAELALGYQGSVNALTTMDTGKILTEDEKPDIVQQWRQANPRIKNLWYRIQDGAISAVKTGQPATVNGIVFTYEGVPDYDMRFLTITLPSSRKLFYVRPFIVQGQYGDNLRYWGVKNGRWCKQETYGGKLVENIVQAIARDCLAVAIERLNAAGYKIVFHVHDEVLVEAAAATTNEAESMLADVCVLASQPMPWAHDLPLGADGWIGDFYTKE